MSRRWTQRAGPCRRTPRRTGAVPFDPYGLCKLYGISILPLEGLADFGCAPESIAHLTFVRPEVWSAALVPEGTGRFILENTVHEPARRRSNIAHEAGHLMLEHEFDTVLWTDDGR